MIAPFFATLLVLTEDCGCQSGVYRDVVTGQLGDGYLADCPMHQDMHEAEMLAEIEAERRNERFWEERGWQEARLQEEMEARMGVIPFEVARELAERV